MYDVPQFQEYIFEKRTHPTHNYLPKKAFYSYDLPSGTRRCLGTGFASSTFSSSSSMADPSRYTGGDKVRGSEAWANCSCSLLTACLCICRKGQERVQIGCVRTYFLCYCTKNRHQWPNHAKLDDNISKESIISR